MKKAKIMLLTILVAATVGGSLAFNAQRFGLTNVWCLNSDGICARVFFRTTNLSPFVTTPCINDHPPAFTTSYYTTNTCPTPVRVIKVTSMTDQ